MGIGQPPDSHHQDQQSIEADSFWTARKPAAVLKHGILSRHLMVYGKKLGVASRNGRIVYVDGYAGEGRYEDGSPGSPAVAIDTARQLAGLSRPRRLDAFLCEKDGDAYRKLVAVLDAEAVGLAFQHRCGGADRHLDEALAFARDAPTFAFLDPYGQLEPFESVVRILNRSAPSHRPQTELLLNFSAFFVRRVDVNNPRKMANIDAVCGGGWWRRDFLATPDKSRATDAVVRGYVRMVQDATGCLAWIVPARNHQLYEPVYYLLFFTRHRDGFWLFGENTSLAMRDWRRFCWEHGPRALGGEDTLFGEETFDHLEEQAVERWIREIKSNLGSLIREHNAPFNVADHYLEVMGSAIGQARGMHVKAAAKRLHQEGQTATTGAGPAENLVILPPKKPNAP